MVRRILASTLTVDATVQIALLIIDLYRRLLKKSGLSAADLAGKLSPIPNPKFDLTVKFPDHSRLLGTYIDYSAAIACLSILMIPLKKAGCQRFSCSPAALRVADETLELISDVKRAFSHSEASQQLLQRLS